MITYEVYGLIVQSEVEFPEVLLANQTDTIDVTIQYGEMPDIVFEKKAEGYESYLVFPRYSWFHVPEVGDYYIENGTTIIVKEENNPDVKLFRAMILGAALTTALMQRNIIAIHGGCVVMNNKGILVSGYCGSGKSTIVTELMKSADGFVADDTVAIDVTANGSYARPTYPQQKLCRDAAIQYGYDISKLVRLDEEREKYGIKRLDEFIRKPVKLGLLCTIRVYDGDELVVEEINGAEKISTIYNNLYLSHVYREIGAVPQFMKDCLLMAQTVPMILIKRPKNKNTVQEIVEKINEIIYAN